MVTVGDVGIGALEESCDNLTLTKDYDGNTKYFYAQREPSSQWIVGLVYPQSLIHQALIHQLFGRRTWSAVLLLSGYRKISALYD